jgi:hypothetical protein
VTAAQPDDSWKRPSSSHPGYSAFLGLRSPHNSTSGKQSGYGMLSGSQIESGALSMSRPDSGALNIPAADGYHFADDHLWDAQDQKGLIDVLWGALDHFTQSQPGDTYGPGTPQ